MATPLATIGNIYIHPIADAQLDGSAVGAILKNPADRATAIEYVKDAVNRPGSLGVYKALDNQDLFLSGNYKLTDDMTEDMFKARLHRGEAIVCVDRSKVELSALECVKLACIVYSKDAALADPQVTDEVRNEIEAGGFEYMLVTFLASAHDEPPAVSSHRFVRNLAGGNNDYKGYSKTRLVEICKDIINVEQEYMTVG
tara:strand:+ start:796 stop:1392 length:597 start_codon:yes stop_codon:yes gene_type:complete